MSQLLKDSAFRGDSRQPAAADERSHRAVLKFGGSVLRSYLDVHRVAGEIYRQLLAYRQIFVVVSAFKGDTDELLSRAAEIAGMTECAGQADVASIGEELAASLLGIACSRIGIDAILLRPEEWAITATGSDSHAEPLGIPPLPERVPHEGVIIVPGFVALNEEGNRVLLGRGGSDFTAVFLAGELGADCVRLYKNVDGVYDGDPSKSSSLNRFEEIDWASCYEIGSSLLHSGAVDYARRRQLEVEVGCIGSDAPTRVTSRLRRGPPLRNEPLSVGLAGFGVVGQALYERLMCEPDFNVSAILVRDVRKRRRVYPPFELTNNLRDFQQLALDIVIDVTCGADAGAPLSCHQLERGGALISANKAVVEPWFEKLSRLSVAEGGFLGISACVGGGTPVLELIDRYAFSPGIATVSAVLSGTVNFVLDQLSRGQSFDKAVECAQRAGFAEENPTQDLSGRDAETKLRLIARRAFGDRELSIFTQALTPERANAIVATGKRWIQLARIGSDENGISGSISFVPASVVDRLPPLRAERNFARVRLVDGREFDVRGRGAGGAPTAEALVADMFAFKQFRPEVSVALDRQC